MSHPNCPTCQLNHYVIKAGLNRSCTQRYRCQDCARYFTPQPKPQGYDPQTPVSKRFNFIWKALLIGRLGGC